MIARHEIKNPQMAGMSRDSEHETLSEGIPVIVSDPTMLGWMRNNQQKNAAIAVTLGLAKSETNKDLHYASLFGVALWKLASMQVDTLTLDIEGNEHVIAQKRIAEYTALTDWLGSLRISMLLRRNEDITALQIAAEVVFGKDFLSETPYNQALGQFHFAISSNDTVAARAALGRWESAGSENGNIGEHNRKLLNVPQINLWQAILDKDKARAETMLTKALESHKVFWGSKEEKQNEYGWISLPLLAACAYAYDHGMDLNVESDYIPRWLYMGEGIKQ
ncbi:MAG: hypothetical protein RLZZ519_2303 [Bacteroidota bacterium]